MSFSAGESQAMLATDPLTVTLRPVGGSGGPNCNIVNEHNHPMRYKH